MCIYIYVWVVREYLAYTELSTLGFRKQGFQGCGRLCRAVCIKALMCLFIHAKLVLCCAAACTHSCDYSYMYPYVASYSKQS